MFFLCFCKFFVLNLCSDDRKVLQIHYLIFKVFSLFNFLEIISFLFLCDPC